jgi:hypothetical protein
MLAFTTGSRTLLPHFAYGASGKPGHEPAHAMHLADHLSSFEPRPEP